MRAVILSILLAFLLQGCISPPCSPGHTCHWTPPQYGHGIQIEMQGSATQAIRDAWDPAKFTNTGCASGAAYREQQGSNPYARGWAFAYGKNCGDMRVLESFPGSGYSYQNYDRFGQPVDRYGDPLRYEPTPPRYYYR